MNTSKLHGQKTGQDREEKERNAEVDIIYHPPIISRKAGKQGSVKKCRVEKRNLIDLNQFDLIEYFVIFFQIMIT